MPFSPTLSPQTFLLTAVMYRSAYVSVSSLPSKQAVVFFEPCLMFGVFCVHSVSDKNLSAKYIYLTFINSLVCPHTK